MAIQFLSDGNINDDLQVQAELIVGSGTASYSKIRQNAISLYDSLNANKGQIFVNESGSSHLLMINNGTTSGGTVYFGAPTSYTQNVIVQGGYLTVGNYLDIEGRLIKMDAPGTTTAVDVIGFNNVTYSAPLASGHNLQLGDVAQDDLVENVDILVMGDTYLQIQDSAIVSKANTLKFTGTLGSSPITQFWGLDANGVVQKRTKSQFASDAGIVRTTTNQTIVGNKTFTGVTTFQNAVTQTGGGTTTLSGDLDVQGSGISLVDDITFSGNGRIQGIDTVSASTDAANKAYVDAHPSGSMSSWTLTADSGGSETISNAETVDIAGGTNITTVRSGATVTINNGITNNNQLTNGQGYVTSSGVTNVSGTAPVQVTAGATPTVSVDTAAVSSGSSKLALGSQIQTAIDAAIAGSGTMSSWNATADNGGTAQIDNAETVDFAGGTAVNTARSGNTITINCEITNNNQLTNGAGYTTNTGTTTASNTQTFTNKSGNISQWTNDSGYITSSGAGMTNWNLTADSGGSTSITSNETVDFEGGTNITTARSGNKITITNGVTNNNQLTNGAGYTTNTGTTTASNTQTFTNKSGNISQWTNDSGYLTSAGSMSNWKATADNGGTATIDDAETVDFAGGTNINTARSGNTITINNEITNNTQLTNGAGYSTNTGTTTASNTQTFTNKSGNISQWTNDAGYVTSSGGSMSSWNLQGDSGGSTSITNGETVDIAGGTNITTSRSSNTITINNGITNNNQLTNGAGYTTNTGTVTSVGATAPILSSGGTSPTISADTAAVTNGGSKLATGDQIYDFVGGWQFSAGGGDVSGTAQLGQSVILTMATVNSNVGSFTNANITVDAKGRITAASSGSGGGVTGSGTTNFLSKWSSSSAIGNSEISDTGSVIQLGLDASNNSTLYLDTTNRKVGFRTTSPGAAFDVNGTMRVRNQLNVGNTSEQNLYVDGNGAAGGKYVKMGNYGGSSGNYFGITDAANQPKFSAAFGSGGKVVQDKRIVTVKLSASALNDAHGDSGKILIAAPGANSVLWPTNIFMYRGTGQPGTGWTTGTTNGASFYFCTSGNCAQASRRIIAVMAGGVCSASNEWFWGRPVPLPTINENPNVRWDGLKNQPLRFKTASNISNATMDWYIRIEYLKINVTAGFVNNVDTTVT